jgi:putative colanic acid biosynthesis acetyltransferase WcaF
MKRDLSKFSGAGYDKGRSVIWQASWVLVASVLFERVWCPPRIKPSILRAFGATVGQGVIIRRGARVHWPWKLHLSDHVWIGVDAWILNLEPINVGANVCLSQGAILCAGSHSRSSPTFEFDNGPITIEDHAWIAIRAIVLRGVTVGEGSVVGAGVVLSKSTQPHSITVTASPITIDAS